MNWLDKTISWISPRAGLARARARAAESVVLGYEGANAGRRTAGWNTASTGANAEISSSLVKLRDRSRDAVRNNPYAARAINELSQVSIGTGILGQTQSDVLELNQAIDEVWDAWGAECDADGQLDFNGLQELVARAVFESGECLVRRRLRFSADNFRVPMQIQVLESDMLDMGRTARLENGGYIVNGVEFDVLGRRVAYWIYPEHPGDVISVTQLGNVASRRVPASEIIHIYRKRRPGQVRGAPVLAPVLLAMRDLDEYLDAERVRKKIEACLTAFVTQPDGVDGPPLGPLTTEQTGQRLEEFRPGAIIYGRPGEKAEFFAPTGAGGFVDCVRQNERLIASGIGITYEQLTGDLSGVNYSSYKAGHLSFQNGIESFRWLCFIPQFLTPVRAWFIDAATAAGEIPVQEYRTKWIPPSWGSIEPLKEAQAIALDLESGRITWPDMVAEQGRDPRSQLEQITLWKPLLEKAGIMFGVTGGRTGGQQQSQDSQAQN